MKRNVTNERQGCLNPLVTGLELSEKMGNAVTK